MQSHARRPLTKIVATVGPASESEEMLLRLVRAGVTTFRLNFSHGDQAGHRAVFTRIRKVAQESGELVTILQDLQGPKLRVGDLEGDQPVMLEDGARFTICTEPVAGTAQRVSTSYRDLGKDVRPGDTILIDDGLIALRVEEVARDTPYGDEARTVVVHGGLLKPRKGINLPGTNVSLPAMTPKDEADLALGIELGVDMVALSFVRTAMDVETAKERIRALGGSQPLISKIEKPQAIEHLEDIVKASDGLMVARGDLGVELSPDQVPMIQKRLIRLANDHGKPVITATQMLESMIEHPRPTRAEASDIANAILDGTDAVMLSGETAVGAWPDLTVRTMAQIARTIESDQSWKLAMSAMTAAVVNDQSEDEAQAIARAAATIATDQRAHAIAVLTSTGATARRVAQQRPGVPILAFADRQDVAASLSLWHGIEPIWEELASSTDAAIEQVARGVRDRGYASGGNLIVIVGSVPRRGDHRSVFLEMHHLE